MPRRVSRKPKASHTPARPRTKEPLAEGTMKRGKKRRRRRLWGKMSDGEIVAYAKRFVKKEGISGIGELQKMDMGLYRALRKRRLMGRVGLKEKRRYWASMSDDEIVAYAKRFMKEKGIQWKSELEKADNGFYQALRKRKLLDRVGFEKKLRDWASIDDEELVNHAKRFMKENGISGRGELEKMDLGLYNVLLKRKLMDRVGFEEKLQDWASMSDDELVSYAKRVMKKKGISARGELRKENIRLYDALWRRELLDRVGFEDKRRPKGFFSKMGDEELVAYAKRIIKEGRIDGKSDLTKADTGLYLVLRKRKLLDKVGLEEKKREKGFFSKMSDDEIVAYAKRIIKENRIEGKKELKKADSGLYDILRIRKLLDKVGLKEKQRNWASMGDDELVDYAKVFVKEKEITGRWDLGKTNKRLYGVLHRRKLLDRVFADIEQARQRHADDEVIRVLEEFGGS